MDKKISKMDFSLKNKKVKILVTGKKPFELWFLPGGAPAPRGDLSLSRGLAGSVIDPCVLFGPVCKEQPV